MHTQQRVIEIGDYLIEVFSGEAYEHLLLIFTAYGDMTTIGC